MALTTARPRAERSAAARREPGQFADKSQNLAESDLGLEVINRIVFDYGHANLERKREIVCDLASDPCVERKDRFRSVR